MPSKTQKVQKHVTDVGDFNKCFILGTIHEFYVQEKMLATISELLAKLRDRFNIKSSSTRLRNTVKELGSQWKKTGNSAVVLIKKHNVRCMQIIILHAGGCCCFIPSALVIFDCDNDQTLNFLFYNITCKDYHYLLR
jgi:hypothetical protein